MTDPKPRRLKKRHVAGGTLLGGVVLVFTTWASIAPTVCPVLPERVAKALCAPALLAAGVADGGVP